MGRVVHKATDALSAEAWQVMIAGWRAKKTLRAVARDLAEIGVKVPERTIARRRSEWIAEENRVGAAREHMQHLIAAVKQNNLAASEMLHALGVDALLTNPQAFPESDPLEAEKLRIKRSELDLKREQLELDRAKFAALQSKLAAVKEKAGQVLQSGELPAEAKRTIREIYDLGDKAA